MGYQDVAGFRMTDTALLARSDRSTPSDQHHFDLALASAHYRGSGKQETDGYPDSSKTNIGLDPETPSSKPTVYVVDNFNNGHGNIIDALIREGTGLEPIRLNLASGNGKKGEAINNVADKLDQILSSRDGELEDVFVNLSLSFELGTQEALPEQWAKLEGKIRDLVDRGAKVFVAAGNDFPNALTGIPGVITVGSDTKLRPNGLPYAENAEIDVRADPVVNLKRVPGGIDITGDGKADLPEQGATRPIKRPSISGTSFATPRALVDAVNSGNVPPDKNTAPPGHFDPYQF